MFRMKIKYEFFVYACVYLLILVAAAPELQARAEPPPATPRPNIVLINADDLGWGDVGFNGRTDWKTPELDALAAGGTIFRRFYAAAAVCCPSRAAMLTGKYTIHCGVTGNNDDLPDSETTIAEALKSLGYVTALAGKWHHGKPPKGSKTYIHPMDQGFDEFFGFTDATEAHQKYPKKLWNGRSEEPVSGYADDLFADRAIAFLRGRAGTKQPFFLYLAFTNSHFAIEAPADEIAAYNGKFAETDPQKPFNATYAAMIARLDKNVGKVKRTLDELNLSRDTLIVFTSDQGATFEVGNRGASVYHDSNRPFRGQKRTVWEGGVRVPSFALWPGRIPAGSSNDEVMHAIDLLPTFVAAAGSTVKTDWKVDGVNLWPVWLGTERAPDRTIFWEWRSEGGNQVAATRGKYKLVITNQGKAELFDVIADPAERRDLSAIRNQEASSLRKALNSWLASEVRRRDN